uniref:Uncharacterized protein n=1 Tax=Kalanchoe fedtschenkoi TaxID=63787 RepID=A0A7N0ZWN9_KALFE
MKFVAIQLSITEGSTQNSCNMSSSSNKRLFSEESIETQTPLMDAHFLTENELAELCISLAPSKTLIAGRKYIRRKSKRRAVYWVNFMEYLEDYQLRAECKFCDKNFAADATVNGSKNVKLHSEKCDKNPANEDRGKGKYKQTELVFEPAAGDDGGKLKNWVFDFNEVREALTYMIIVDELPFRFVDKCGFRNLMHVMNPRFQIPSRVTIGRDCYEIYLKEKVILKEFIAKSCQRISITTDTWTSIRTVNYMCVTAHFIDHE